VAVSRHFVVALGGPLFAAGTIGGLILSVEVGPFGFMDSVSAPYATTSLIAEAAAFVVLLRVALLGLRRRTQTAR
jgi:ABC-type xylose transport system permease subunit